MHELARSLAGWPGIRALILSRLGCCLIRTYLSGNYVVLFFFPFIVRREKYDKDLGRERERQRERTLVFFHQG